VLWIVCDAQAGAGRIDPCSLPQPGYRRQAQNPIVVCGSGKRSKAEFADGFDCMRLAIGKSSLAAATQRCHTGLYGGCRGVPARRDARTVT
jgi:hypothetical protein